MLVTYQNTKMHRPKNIKFWLEHVGEKIVSKYRVWQKNLTIFKLK